MADNKTQTPIVNSPFKDAWTKDVRSGAAKGGKK